MYFVAHIVNPVFFTFAILGVLWGLRAFIEWKYRRESKHYITHALGSTTFLLTFCIIIIFTMPRDIDTTVNGFLYSDSGGVNETVTIQVVGTITRNLFFGDLVKGQININEKKFWLITAINPAKSDVRRFDIVELSGRAKGEVWITKDYQTFIGDVEGLSIDPTTPITFAAPAETVEEAKQIYSGRK
ncbi:MAG: DUF4181 domain-containing protein [Firmicutes bacterium]|nr:DUF4181 domain-containing protein [Bacillota bacterium]